MMTDFIKMRIIDYKLNEEEDFVLYTTNAKNSVKHIIGTK